MQRLEPESTGLAITDGKKCLVVVAGEPSVREEAIFGMAGKNDGIFVSVWTCMLKKSDTNNRNLM